MRRISTACVLLFASTIISLNINAGDRTTAAMQKIALERLAGNANVTTKSADLKLIATSATFFPTTKAAEGNEAFYVYSLPEQGFVIVSGDDSFKPVLGYSKSETFPVASMPSNLLWWLSKCVSGMKDIKENGTTPVLCEDPTFQTKATETATSVSPLLTSKWHQSSPFSDLCPVSGLDTTPAGCVAIALSQIMNYYKYPTKGIGTHTYYCDSLKVKLSADFGNTTYDWGNMLDSYSSSSTAAQRSAVATLAYHCGVAVNMMYSADGSGAYTSDAVTALINYFGYDGNARYYSREYYTDSEWHQLVREDLSAGRPLIYGGVNADKEGHAFVIDGYEADSLVHVNWGWGGGANGYYALDILEPKYSSGRSVCKGFSDDQDMVTGIQKSSTTSKYVSQWIIDKALTLSDTPSSSSGGRPGSSTSKGIYLTCEGLYNYSPVTFNGQIGVVLLKDDVYTGIVTADADSVQFLHGYSITDEALNFPSSLANGTYKLFLASKGTSEDTWQIMRSKSSVRNFYYVTINGSSITYNKPVMTAAEEISVKDNSSIYTSDGEIHVYMDNDGTMINVYDLSGRLVMQRKAANGWNTLTPEVKGMLIVSAGNKSEKVIIR